MCCCKELNEALEGPETPLVKSFVFREYGLKILDGGTSYLGLAYCPFCGNKFQGSLRMKWFEILEKKGFEPDDDLPEELRSDKWWREKIYD